VTQAHPVSKALKALRETKDLMGLRALTVRMALLVRLE
jgi:hypothetical protein